MTTDPTLYSYGERRDYVRGLSKMTRAAFDALSEADRERIVTRLRFVIDRNDTRTVRDSMGCSIRGAGAQHTSTARTLLRVFTETHAPAPDNSTAGRLTRYTEATTYHQASEAIRRATKVQMIDICRAVGLYHSPSWKNDKFTRVLLERFGNGGPVDPIGPLAAPGDRVAASVDGGPEVWTGTVTGWEDPADPVRVWVRWDHDGSSTDLHRASLVVVQPDTDQAAPDTDAAYASPWATV